VILDRITGTPGQNRPRQADCWNCSPFQPVSRDVAVIVDRSVKAANM